MLNDQHQERRRPGQDGQTPLSTLIHLPALVVLDRIPVAVLAISQDGTILFANPTFASMLGYSLESLHTLKFSELFTTLPTDQSSPVSVMRLHGGERVELVHADGSTVHAWMSKSALLRDDDPVALVTFQDLTAQLWQQNG
ncbi:MULTISPECIES: PAS domain-containing protein [Mycobacterium]|jgi:PAS domain S-box-containing protein|uniref:PAS domain-containing protein n=1 Tax=Mycobacterium paragordonae TaxID=1389713 RepID=A0AAJ1W6X7_9MYCO|nr:MULTISPECIES: PAS domain-containing protein [Mycobacterium]MDP7733076.1 PAS domain-containing protein [Mycobacterium sp. TY813]MDP7739771.1 PAS domain-containing protein [Mycobacterium paragordonae]OBJ81738.1 histidine kinase [Mycobacterium gordonae]